MSAHDQVRLGVIGLGNIGLQHLANVSSGAVSNCRITAVCSRQPHPVAGELSAQHFVNAAELIRSGLCDAVLVATPTFTHFDIGALALQQGLHLLMEKPVGLSAWEGEQLLEMASSAQVFAVMLNQRTDPVYLHMKQMVANGELGELQRTHWTMTNWFRPEIYFQASEWRATWRGEGGGLLVNQCIHNLDIFQWVCGMPVRLHARCGFGKYHDIEVEDEATAMLEYANGATGVFIASSGEAPGVNRFDVVGDSGTLSYDGSVLRHFRNDPGTAEFSRDTAEMFGAPATTETDITPHGQVNQHALVLQNFVDAITSDTALIAAAAGSIDSLNLANGMLLSAWRDQGVDFPLDTWEYHEELVKRMASSRPREKSDAEVVIDMQKSYR
jgi:predicted dehydrogenase